MARQCKATTKDGEPCNAIAVTGKDFCWMHDPDRGPRGPLKFDELKREEYLDRLRDGMGRGRAAAAVGLHADTVREYKKREPAFAQLESIAEMEASGEVENALFEAAMSGNVTAAIFYLKNRLNAEWCDRHDVGLSGADGGDLKIRVKVVDDDA